jgi:MFS family permease
LQKPPAHILPLIILSQFAGTSLWFAGNAVIPELTKIFSLDAYAVSLMTSAVMLGFIGGTLVFAFFSLADRIPPVRLFLISCLAGAAANAAVTEWASSTTSLFLFRFITGFFLAGIYPVGMKIAADWYDKGLGKALGFLVGALVFGTAFPHLLKANVFAFSWKAVMYTSSVMAVTGGVLMWTFVGDGPYRKTSGRFQWNAIGEIFRSRDWRNAAFGYFGHMWELYAFWGFLPVMLVLYQSQADTTVHVPLLSFAIIATGGLGCMAGGFIADKMGSARTASIALLISGLCCLLSPFLFSAPQLIFLAFLFTWGFTVAMDSPQFSTLVAQHAPPHLRGTALTIYNSIGFGVATISIFITDRLLHSVSFLSGKMAFVQLACGALFGLPFMLSYLARNPTRQRR